MPTRHHLFLSAHRPGNVLGIFFPLGNTCVVPVTTSSVHVSDDEKVLILLSSKMQLWSQTWHSLHMKARWWFNVSHHDVKIVLLTKLDKTTRQIRIEKWKYDVLPPMDIVTLTPSDWNSSSGTNLSDFFQRPAGASPPATCLYMPARFPASLDHSQRSLS